MQISLYMSYFLKGVINTFDDEVIITLALKFCTFRESSRDLLKELPETFRSL